MLIDENIRVATVADSVGVDGYRVLVDGASTDEENVDRVARELAPPQEVTRQLGAGDWMGFVCAYHSALDEQRHVVDRILTELEAGEHSCLLVLTTEDVSEQSPAVALARYFAWRRTERTLGPRDPRREVDESWMIQAVKEGNVKLVRRLVCLEPAWSATRDRVGNSLLLKSLYQGNKAIADVLAAARDDFDIFEAIALNFPDHVNYLLEEDWALSNRQAPDGLTPLHLASLFARTKMVNTLLDFGANANAPSGNAVKATPLHFAAVAGSEVIVEMLLTEQANPNAQQAEGLTALMVAAQGGNLSLARALLAAGADTSITDNEGKTAADFARDGGYTELAELLRPPPAPIAPPPSTPSVPVLDRSMKPEVEKRREEPTAELAFNTESGEWERVAKEPPGVEKPAELEFTFGDGDWAGDGVEFQIEGSGRPEPTADFPAPGDVVTSAPPTPLETGEARATHEDELADDPTLDTPPAALGEREDADTEDGDNGEPTLDTPPAALGEREDPEGDPDDQTGDPDDESAMERGADGADDSSAGGEQLEGTGDTPGDVPADDELDHTGAQDLGAGDTEVSTVSDAQDTETAERQEPLLTDSKTAEHNALRRPVSAPDSEPSEPDASRSGTETSSVDADNAP